MAQPLAPFPLALDAMPPGTRSRPSTQIRASRGAVTCSPAGIPSPTVVAQPMDLWLTKVSACQPATSLSFAQWYTTAGLKDIGKGAGVMDHYRFYYDSSLAGSGLEPKRANALLAAAGNGQSLIENDYQIMSDWFSGRATPGGLTFPVYTANLNGSARRGGHQFFMDLYVLCLPNADNSRGVKGSQIWAKSFSDPNHPNQWSGWSALGPTAFPSSASITTLSTRPGGTGLYALGFPNADDGHGIKGSQVWTKFFPDPSHPNQWSDWFPLGPNIFRPFGPVTALSTHPGETSLYIQGLDCQKFGLSPSPTLITLTGGAHGSC
ncbi:hypothetical protein GP486_002110 [Trichoglossum hirsutum]|uniref:Uncharacterized protein n=1 Tax=Trichoglossum hirsutum TaxID=265104 RepID=A0A9P8RS20_9PEZI|nr:hypothetical protein GP486_002110 [Trichoglossum hirsutum]